MATALERLHAWMEANDYDAESLASELGYVYPITGYVNGYRKLGPSFQWMFGRKFGSEALLEVFGIAINDAEYARGVRVQVWQPDRYAARLAVARAMRQGELSPAKEHSCTVCNARADQWHHHRGYAPEHWLDVIAMCCTCHARLHAEHNREPA